MKFISELWNFYFKASELSEDIKTELVLNSTLIVYLLFSHIHVYADSWLATIKVSATVCLLEPVLNPSAD